MQNLIYTYILSIYYLVGLGWVLWHINHCRLFNAKSYLYIYILNIYDFVLLGFINHSGLFNAKSSLYIFIKYIGFGLCCVIVSERL